MNPKLVFICLFALYGCKSKQVPNTVNASEQQIGAKDKKARNNYQYSVYDKRTGPYRIVYLDKTRKYGMADSTGKIIIPAKYDNLYTSETGLFRAQQNNKWGYIDLKGKIIIPFGKYEGIQEFSERRAAVYNGKAWGFIDEFGNKVVDYLYFNVTDFHEGRAFVTKAGNSNAAIIDLEGNLLSDFVFSCNNMCFFRNNTAVVYYKNNSLDIIDKNGSPRFGFAYMNLKFLSVDDNVFWAQQPGEKYMQNGIAYTKAGLWGLVSADNRLIIPFQLTQVDFFKNGSATAQKNNKWGRVDESGKIIQDFIYDSAAQVP